MNKNQRLCTLLVKHSMTSTMDGFKVGFCLVNELLIAYWDHQNELLITRGINVLLIMFYTSIQDLRESNTNSLLVCQHWIWLLECNEKLPVG